MAFKYVFHQKTFLCSVVTFMTATRLTLLCEALAHKCGRPSAAYLLLNITLQSASLYSFGLELSHV
jgi:hypothetical protein